MKNIPTDSLIANYLPADHIDTFSRVVARTQSITPKEFLDLAFTQLPKWINWLMKLRNAIVKPLKLETSGRFMDMICAKSPTELIFGMPDKHLTFYVSMWCGDYKDSKQELRITTVVKYNNWFGKLYFFVIRPFHNIIVNSLLKNVGNLAI